MNKKLLFAFSLISLFGLFLGLGGAGGYNAIDKLFDFLSAWVGFSLPLIILVIHYLIFRSR